MLDFRYSEHLRGLEIHRDPSARLRPDEPTDELLDAFVGVLNRDTELPVSSVSLVRRAHARASHVSV